MSRLLVRTRPTLGLLALCLLAFTVGCPGAETPTETETPAISVSIAPTSASVEQGASTDVDVTVTGSGGFTGPATITLQSAPSGVAGTVADVVTTGGNTTATLTISVGAAVAPGSYDLTVRATGSGVAAVTAAFALTVTAAPAYELTATPDALTIEQEAEGTTDIGIARTNFTGDVTLSVEGAPGGMTTSFDANPVAGDAAVLTIDVDGAVTPGVHTLTLRGAATGLADRTVTIDVTVTEPAPPAYELAVAPTTVTVDQGESGETTVTLTRTNFAEAVTLALEGEPAGVTGTFSVNPVGGTTSVLTLDVGAAVTLGDHTLTVRGTSSLPDETATVTLTVTEPPGFVIHEIAPLSIQQGASDSRLVSIGRNAGFAGDVTVTVTDLPAGITATVDPVTTGGNSVTVTIDVAGTVAVGNYQVTVRGNATGEPEATQTLDISVTTASGQEVVIDVGPCTTFQRPAWLAYKDGSGPWTPVTSDGDTYTFNVASPTVAVAAVISPPMAPSQVLVYHATVDELLTFDIADLCDLERMGKTVNASVSGIGAGEGASITLGDDVVELSANGGFSFNTVPSGNLDLVGYKWSFTGGERMILDRDLNPSDGSSLGTLDFAGAGAFDPIFADITVQGGSGGGGAWFMEYATSPGGGACYYAPLDDFAFAGNTFTVGGAPAAEQEAGDFHVVTVTDGLFTASETFAALADRTISYGPALPIPTITDITGGAAYRRVRAQFTLPAEYNESVAVTLVDGTGDAIIASIATAAWLGGPSVDLRIPDFTGLAGWNDFWAPTSASTTSWGVQGFGWTGDDCTEGARESSAGTTGTIG